MTMDDIRRLSMKELKGMVEKETERIGYKMLTFKELPHEADCYLKYVLGYNEKKEEYGVWLWNVQMGGLHYGHYFDHWFGKSQEEARQKAWDDFLNR